MALQEEFVSSGQWLFRHRGFLPIAGVALVLSQVKSVATAAGPEVVPLQWPLICFGVSLVGVALRAYTVGCAASGTSGRNRDSQKAASLNTTASACWSASSGQAVGWMPPITTRTPRRR